MMEKMDGMSMDLAATNIEKLKELFPNAVTEGKIDFDMLRSMLGDEVDTSKEKYQFTWNGKAESIKLAQSPSSATLRPCKEKSKNWDTTENLYIEGDNLEVLKQLQKTYFGKIKMIYIDPPYNTGNDFVYKDDFKNSLENYIEQTSQTAKSNPETSGRYHSDWLNLMYPRLLLARNLLSDDGVIFISIDNNEFENLSKICNEIFGVENLVDYITWNTRVPKNDNKGLGNIHQYILVYVKNHSIARQFTMRKEGLDEVYELLEKMKKQGISIPEAEEELKKFYNKKGFDRGITLYNALDEDYKPWGKINMSWPNSDTFGPTYDVIHPATGKVTKKPDRGWRWNKDTFESHLDYDHVIKRHDGSFVCGDIWFAKDENTQPSSIKYLHDVDKMLLRTIISLKSDGGVEVEKLFGGKSIFSNPKPTSLISLLLDSVEEKDLIILDFFSGSATTAHSVMQLNSEDGGCRKYIMVQLPEQTEEKSEAYKTGYNNLCEIGEERIRLAGEKIKADWIENHKQGSLLEEEEGFQTDIGFRVFTLDSTNINPWDNTNEYDESSLLNTATVFKLDRSKEDVLYEIMLKYGVFDQPASEVEVNGKTMYRVGQRHMIVCLEDHIDDSDIAEICKLEPRVVVFKEDGFKDDNAKMNAEYNLKKAGVEDVKCI